jgi:hypothetical protein
MTPLILIVALVLAGAMSLSLSIRDWNRRFYQDLSKSARFATTDTTSTSWITCPGLRYTLFVQRIIVNIVTDAAQTLTIRDSNGTPKVLTVLPSSPGVGPQMFDFGDEGFGLTEGKNLDVVLSAAGLAFDLSIECFAKPTSTRIPSEI